MYNPQAGALPLGTEAEEVADVGKGEATAAYRQAPEATASALVERSLRPDGTLLEGCYNKRIGLATENELIWGSYYLFEALHVLTGALEPNRI